LIADETQFNEIESVIRKTLEKAQQLI
jgi:hypothetical protein